VTVAPEPTSPEPARPGLTARPFAHLNAPLHLLYRQIMTVFRDSKQRFVVHLRPEDVAEALRAAAGTSVTSQEEIAEALGKLEGWGNLRATPDTSRVTTRGLLPDQVPVPAQPRGRGGRTGPGSLRAGDRAAR
jgi:Protein of unknown function (DUF2397)